MGLPNAGRQAGRVPSAERLCTRALQKATGQLAGRENKAISCQKPSKPSSNTSLHLCAEARRAISLPCFSPALNQVSPVQRREERLVLGKCWVFIFRMGIVVVQMQAAFSSWAPHLHPDEYITLYMRGKL